MGGIEGGLRRALASGEWLGNIGLEIILVRYGAAKAAGLVLLSRTNGGFFSSGFVDRCLSHPVNLSGQKHCLLCLALYSFALLHESCAPSSLTPTPRKASRFISQSLTQHYSHTSCISLHHHDKSMPAAARKLVSKSSRRDRIPSLPHSSERRFAGSSITNPKHSKL